MGKKRHSLKHNKRRKTDLEILEELQEKIVDELRRKEINPRVSDLLKALELKIKLRLSDQDKEKIWELINQIRGEILQDDSESSSS
jgi:hypothetical protein